MVSRADCDAYFRTRKAPGPLECEPGDRVCYTRYFLRQMGTPPTGDAWQREGMITERTAADDRAGWVLVQWFDDPEPMSVSRTVLAFPGANRRRCD